MPDSASKPNRWILLGRLLPKRTRERIFEPAYYELLKAHLLKKRTRMSLGASVLGLYFGSVAVTLQRMLVSRRSAIMGIILLGLATIVFFLQSWFGHMYAMSDS